MPLLFPLTVTNMLLESGQFEWKRSLKKTARSYYMIDKRPVGCQTQRPVTHSEGVWVGGK